MTHNQSKALRIGLAVISLLALFAIACNEDTSMTVIGAPDAQSAIQDVQENFLADIQEDIRYNNESFKHLTDDVCAYPRSSGFCDK